MKKKTIISVLLEIIGYGIIAKCLSMVAKILTTREIGLEGMSIFSLLSPAMVLLINLATLGLPTAIATLISKEPKKSKKIFIAGLSISLLISLTLMISMVLFAPVLANVFLKNEETKEAIYALALLIPLVSLSSLLKGYYIGHNQAKMTAKSSILEEIARIIFVIFFLNKFTKISPSFAAFGAIIGICIGEIFQSLFLIIKTNINPKKYLKTLNIKELDPKEEIPTILSLSIPITLSKIVTSLTYFFEPIIITHILINQGFTSSEIATQYGVFIGYVIPILMLPGFFTLAFSNYMLPKLSKLVKTNNIKEANSFLLKILFFCLILGLFCSTFFYFNSEKIMYMLYKTTLGSDTLKILAFPFLIYCFETPLSIAMHAYSLSKKALISTLISSLIRVIILLILVPKMKITAISISILIEIIIVLILNSLFIIKSSFRNNKKTSI